MQTPEQEPGQLCLGPCAFVDSSLGLKKWGNTDYLGRGVGPQTRSSCMSESLVSRGKMEILLPDLGRVEKQKQDGARTRLLLTFCRYLLQNILKIQKSIFWENADL